MSGVQRDGPRCDSDRCQALSGRQQAAQEQVTLATLALRRLALADEMAGTGQRDGDPELTARCRYASWALEQVAAISGQDWRSPGGARVTGAGNCACPLAIHVTATVHGDVPLADVQAALDDFTGQHWRFATGNGTEVTIEHAEAEWYPDDEEAW